MARQTKTAQGNLPLLRIVQIMPVTYTFGDDHDKQGTSVVGLGDDGCVYQYHRGDINAWVPFNMDVFRRV